MVNAFNNYKIKGPRTHNDLFDIRKNYRENIRPTIQSKFDGFMILESSLFINHPWYFQHNGTIIAPIFHKEQLTKPVLSLDSFLEGEYPINNFDQFLLIFETRVNPHIDIGDGEGISPIYISRLNSKKPIVSIPKSGTPYADKAFLKSVKGPERVKNLQDIPYIPVLTDDFNLIQ